MGLFGSKPMMHHMCVRKQPFESEVRSVRPFIQHSVLHDSPAFEAYRHIRLSNINPMPEFVPLLTTIFQAPDSLQCEHSRDDRKRKKRQASRLRSQGHSSAWGRARRGCGAATSSWGG